MTLLNFPDTPAIGDKFPTSPVAGFPQYTWDGEKWTIPSGLISPKQPIYSDGSQAMAAQLTLFADPVAPTDASDKNYVDVTSAAQAAAAAAAAAGTRIKSIKLQVFSTVGSFTYTPSAGMVFCIVDAVAGGGGAGGVVATAATQFYGSCGGSSGGFSRKLCTAADIGANKPVTVGGAGGGGAGNAPGTAGGNTSLGTLCVANGGAPSTQATSTQMSARAASTSGTGDIVGGGKPGSEGQWVNAGSQGAYGGTGGDGPWGGGGLGAIVNASGANGSTAGNYGAGGGGGAVAGLASGVVNGGAGYQGILTVLEFCTQ